jgi:hypothetical protein
MKEKIYISIVGGISIITTFLQAIYILFNKQKNCLLKKIELII